MPTAVSNVPSRYVPRRSPSSEPQPSLQDHSRTRQPSQSQTPPSNYLPSTAYEAGESPLRPYYDQPQQSRSFPARAPYDEQTTDPDDFYRQYNNSIGQEGTKGLHQNAFHAANLEEEAVPARTRQSSVASTQSQDRNTLRVSKSSVDHRRVSQLVATKSSSELGVRKSSFKDLVARFDASPDDVPPVPVFPDVIGGSRKTSPVMTMAAQGNAWKHAASASSARRPSQQASVQPKTSRPLFGEVVPGAINTTAAGYGIVNARRRRQSEGSPMHSPNPMFAEDRNPNYATSNALPVAGANGTQANDQKPGSTHRRAVSEMSPSLHATDSVDDSSPARVDQPHRRRVSSSRIPVSTRRSSIDSGSGTSTPSRAHSKLGHHSQLQGPNTRSHLPALVSTVKSPRYHTSQTQKTPIKTPGKKPRSINTIQGEKGASLRANIIAPPPKISPPLRSSRPRLPVSTATTAASRARIAERFQTMAKEQTDQRSTSRRAKPPELSDIDLKARRLRITQALTKSREGQELRGERSLSKRTSGSGTPAQSTLDVEDSIRDSVQIPALVVENASFGTDDDVFTTPAEGSVVDETVLARTAYRDIPEPRDFDHDADSPTLGQSNSGSKSELPRLDIPQFQGLHNLEDDSALTHETAETNFDVDDEFEQDVEAPDAPSVYDQVRGIRGSTSTSPPSGISPSDGQTMDRTDAESVNLIMRNTTYMDEDEAIAKGYHTFIQPPPLSDLYEGSSNGQGSWTSSLAEQSDVGARDDPSTLDTAAPEQANSGKPSHSTHESSFLSQDSHRATTASDAYTIVNIVLQERSSSGVVDQELVDDIYQRVVDEAPHLALADPVDLSLVEDLCIHNLERYAAEQQSPDLSRIHQESTTASDDEANNDAGSADTGIQVTDELRPPPLPKDSLPPSSYRSGHKYKSSLDSVEDWADTSPSIGDWMSYALTRSESDRAAKPSPLAQEASENEEFGTVAILSRSSEPPALPPKDNFPSLPAHSPPPPPRSKAVPTSSSLASMSTPPEVPDRNASRSQFSSRPVTRESSSIAPSFSTTDELSPAAKKLKQRRHIMKEIVDTEFSYERDMRVLCDIYKETANAVLSDDDVKVIFGNIVQIQEFSKDFLTYLKQVVRPVYAMERKNRMTNSHTDAASVRSLSPDLSDDEKDRLTQVGVAFEASVNDMSVVYTNYIRTRHVANQRLGALQADQAVSEWLRECSENSKDLTHAWSLDALLVKPIQRITKYPLLLTSMLEATPSDHPDIDDLRRALSATTEINFRINDIKKQTELVDQVLNRKRKESDVRNGLTKAFGRRAERLRQHVGVSEVYEDGEFSRIKMEYDNNGVHLLIVSKDILGYTDSIKGWVAKLTGVAVAAEEWVDVGHSNHPEAESKLRQLGSAVRGINQIALPDHVDSVHKKVVAPLESAMVMVERFKNDPKGLLQKRDKKILDYSVARNKRDRGEKLDRKMNERLEQWEAINAEVKQRMRTLLQSTQKLVHVCLHNLVHLHMSWLSMIQQKLSTAMAIDQTKMDGEDLVREWQVDFDYHEATALTLSICNGTLLTEAINLVSFLSPSTTHTADDSPKQPSIASGKRSVSLQSDFSHLPYQNSTRHSSGQHSTLDYPSENSSFGMHSSRMRATSTTSGQIQLARTSEAYNRTPSSGHGFSRPATSLGQVDRATETSAIRSTTMTVPRVSLDAPSPSIGPIVPTATPNRPDSSSTFVSAVAGPSSATSSQHVPQPSVDTAPTTASSIFSSAMPLSDSPLMATEQSASMLPPPGISPAGGEEVSEPAVLFTAASVYEFNIDRARTEGGIPYLTYVAGEIFDVVGERGELWLARNQDDKTRLVGWIWCKHFAKLAV